MTIITFEIVKAFFFKQHNYFFLSSSIFQNINSGSNTFLSH